MPKILVVDDEKKQRDILKLILEKEGYETFCSPSAEEALKIYKENDFDAVITDLKLPKMDGIEFMEEILLISPDTSIIIITGHGTIDSAVSAIKRGAFDYITKPFEKEQLLSILKKAVERTTLLKERKFLSSKLSSKEEFEGIIGEHPSFKNVIKTVFKIANFDSTVLISGESGTGKELIARLIHKISSRKDKPFIPINCAAIPENLIESELFGYERGAFTGATTKKSGIFQAGNGGTIFLDEISEMPLATQAKLLRFLQNKEIFPVGSTIPVKVDVRIVSATNKNLEEEIKNGKFRADLYYRLNIFFLKLPPLRERSSDIPILVNYFLDKYKYLAGGAIKFLNKEALKTLLDYPFYGNIRELESIIQKAIINSDSDEIKKDDLIPYLSGYNHQSEKDNSQTNNPEKNLNLEEIEKNLILKAMEESRWKMSKACKILGITYRTLQYRLEKYGLKEEKNTPKR
ncbi:MAG: sigma-54 dependent transcriptional regulator [Proteobacteria bacterium]|nr:sigma-54 dependent transcriptional regulator [Pseudomonadota bacterium]